MRRYGYYLLLIALAAVFCCIFTNNAYAYLDPGSGSFMFQLLLGAILGASFTIKVFWKKIRDFVISLFRKKPAS